MGEAIEQMSAEMHARRRELEEAEERLEHEDETGAIASLIGVMRGVQARDESLLALRRECQALLEHCAKVLRAEVARRPPAPIRVPDLYSGSEYAVSKFLPGEFPRPEEPLVGSCLVTCVLLPNGELVRWSKRPR